MMRHIDFILIRLALRIVHFIGGDQVVVRTVAKRRRARMLAAAQQHFSILLCSHILERFESAAFVRAVAEGLAGAAAAAAPKIGSTRDGLEVIRLVARYPRYRLLIIAHLNFLGRSLTQPSPIYAAASCAGRPSIYRIRRAQHSAFAQLPGCFRRLMKSG